MNNRPENFKKSFFILLLTAILPVSFLLSGCSRNSHGEGTEPATSVAVTEIPASQVRPPESTTEIKENEPAVSPSIELPFTIEDRMVCMFTDESWQVPVDFQGEGESDAALAGLTWTSDSPRVVSVDYRGNITAHTEGHAVISCSNSLSEDEICINVFRELGGGSCWETDMLTAPDELRTYRNYAQGAYEYGDYSEYVAMHGCAACCTATALGAWDTGKVWDPEIVVRDLEPEANEKAWKKNYAKTMTRQMPLTPKGISRVLTLKEIPHTYVPSFDRDTLEEDLRRHLKKGLPVIYQAGNGGYHMMMLLGLLTDGNVLVSDSVGYYRVRVSSLESVTGQMFSCKEEPNASYFSGRKTAGGYIKVGETDEE